MPPNILEKVKNLRRDDCVVACVVRVRSDELRQGKYAHLGVTLSDELTLEFPSSTLPSSSDGRYSKKNILGYEKVYDEEPKVSKSWSIDSPNFGDWSKGSHDIVFERDVYRREDFPPRLLPILISDMGTDVRRASHLLRFSVDGVLDRRSPSFEDDLLFSLNLLQENVGNHDVFESGTTTDEYLKTLMVSWEILPPGERDQNIERILSGVKTRDPSVRARLLDRYALLTRLMPVAFVKGVSGFHRYFGAQLADDLVLFENIEYGNAMYIMFEEWQALSRLSRTELLSSRTHEFVRIPHTKHWKDRVRAEVRRRRITPR